MGKKVTEKDITKILRKALRGETNIFLHPEETMAWGEAYCEPVDFSVDGWTMRFSNNCGRLNHLDFAVSPDGLRIDLFTKKYNYNGALRLLSAKKIRMLESLLRNAKNALIIIDVKSYTRERILKLHDIISKVILR